LIQSHVIHDSNNCKDARVCYTLPIPDNPQLFLRSVLFLVFNLEYSFKFLSWTLSIGIFYSRRQRVDNHANLSDFQTCNKYNIDNTGLVCKFLCHLTTHNCI